jgi:hypothetical protein
LAKFLNVLFSLVHPVGAQLNFKSRPLTTFFENGVNFKARGIMVVGEPSADALCVNFQVPQGQVFKEISQGSRVPFELSGCGVKRRDSKGRVAENAFRKLAEAESIFELRKPFGDLVNNVKPPEGFSVSGHGLPCNISKTGLDIGNNRLTLRCTGGETRKRGKKLEDKVRIPPFVVAVADVAFGQGLDVLKRENTGVIVSGLKVSRPSSPRKEADKFILVKAGCAASDTLSFKEGGKGSCSG